MPRQLRVLLVCLGILLSGLTLNHCTMPNKESLPARMERLNAKYKLRSYYFDAECLYDEGDLARITQECLHELLPEEAFTVEEAATGNNGAAVATVYYQGKEVGSISSEGGDYLPDDFYQEVEELPERIGSISRIYMLNPRLFGQDGCYVSGSHENLLAAKKEGLPLVLPDQNYLDEDLSEFE
jgi:hypothetical protein